MGLGSFMDIIKQGDEFSKNSFIKEYYLYKKLLEYINP